MEYVLIAMVAFGACIGGNNILLGIGLAEIDTAYQEAAQTLYSTGLWIQLLGTVVVAPVCEELLFRGLIYKRMKEYMTPGMAMFLSALAFGFFHGNMTQMVYSGALGFLMAYVYEKYHNLFAPVLFHAVANLFSVVVTETGNIGFYVQQPSDDVYLRYSRYYRGGSRSAHDSGYGKAGAEDPVSRVEL